MPTHVGGLKIGWTRTMRPNTRFFVKNAILSRFSLQDLAAIGEFLEPIVLKERMVLQEPRRRPDHVYFIEFGLVSLRIVAPGSILETAVIGCRGAVGATLLLGTHLSTHQAVVLFSGRAFRIRVEDFRRVMDERPEIREHLDALDADVLPVTHDYLSSVLGLRRAGITETLIRFEEQRLIRKTRGVLQIDERERLEEKACCCCRLILSAYAWSQSADFALDERLVGSTIDLARSEATWRLCPTAMMSPLLRAQLQRTGAHG